MDSGFELTSLYKLASEEVSEIERTQWPKNPNDPAERLNRIEDALKDICKKKMLASKSCQIDVTAIEIFYLYFITAVWLLRVRSMLTCS